MEIQGPAVLTVIIFSYYSFVLIQMFSFELNLTCATENKCTPCWWETKKAADLERDSEKKKDDRKYLIQERTDSASTVLLSAEGFAKGALLVLDAVFKEEVPLQS